MQAPILFLPDVFENDLCEKLIHLYEVDGGQESGFMRDLNGRAVGLYDSRLKRRRDYTVTDVELMRQIRRRVIRRIIPEMKKIYYFEATRMERYLVGCYATEDKGHFGAHRDNTTRATSHRRFAVSVNLNGDFDGGEVSFPEYGGSRYKMPLGGAIVFSGSLLHSVSRVTSGRRYAFLPFLYDEMAAKERDANAAFLVGDQSTPKS